MGVTHLVKNAKAFVQRGLKNTYPMLPSQLKEQVNNVRTVVSPLLQEPGNNHGFLVDGKFYRKGEVTAQTQPESAAFGVRITTSI